jgi:HPt (histidine-containing phosphotransfer) domain-containing protein
MIHELKGISGILGALDLSEICYKIETAYKHNETITAGMHQQLEKTFHTVQSSLKIIDNTKNGMVRKINKREAVNLIPKLKASLEEFAVI